jgi:hypothetical protein
MSNSFAARIAARFAPLDFTNVYGFPNTVLDIKVWEDVLPKFGEYADDNPAQHLFEFHKLMDELNIHHEDVLMKLFMFSLERDARLWYKSLPHSSIPSLKDFHILFHQHCKRIYSAEILFEDCCNIKFIRQNEQTNLLDEEEGIIGISQVDENNQYEEVLADTEVGYDSSCDHIPEGDIQHHGQSAEEIDLLLNSYVTAPAYTNLQHPHSPENVSETPSTINENLILNDDSHETIQEASEPIYDDDSLPGDQLENFVWFHEKDVAVMFNHTEEFLVFENDLDFDVEGYKSEMGIMPEKGEELPMVDNPRTFLIDNTSDLSVAPRYDEYTDDYNIVSLEQFVASLTRRNDGLQTDAISNEGCLDILFEDDPEKNKLEHAVGFNEACYLKPQDHAFFHDPFADLLDSFYGGVCYVVDILSQESRKSLNIHDQQYVRWELTVSFFNLLKESMSRFQISRQLLDWLHWHFCIF